MTFSYIDVYSRKISTTSQEAQLWFDRGLAWIFAFCNEEAIKHIKKASGFDPN